MQNPLIEFKESLKNNNTSPLFSGVLKPEAYRVREDIQLAKDALSVIEKHFPKLFHFNPHSYTNFAKGRETQLFPFPLRKVHQYRSTDKSQQPSNPFN